MKPPKRTRVVGWLQKTLTTGPVSTAELQALAKQAGHAWATVRRAKVELAVQSVKSNFGGAWAWRLHIDEPRSQGAQTTQRAEQPVQDAQAKEVSALGALAVLARRDPQLARKLAEALNATARQESGNEVSHGS